MVLDVCRDCGGTHFDHGELAELARTRPDELDDVDRLVERHPYSVKIVISRELLCAACGTPMETYEYAFTSGVLLDRCPKCYAVWADDRELQAIQDHIEGRPDPETQGEQGLDPEVRAQMLLNDMKTGSGSGTGRLAALTSLCSALSRRPFGG
jgi:Zn-finger nucleic acid-binding protein